jgi:hypothetical protein
MIYLPLLFACTSAKNVDTSTNSDTGIVDGEPSTEVDDSQEYFGTIPSTVLPVPDFTAQNYDEELRDKNNLVGQPTVIWFFPAAGTYG